MALTSNCDLYGAVNEEGINRVIQHIMRQRPSLFNYGTADVAYNPEMWCAKIDYTKDVENHGNPKFTVENYLPVLGADSPPVSLSFCAQLTRAQLDFHPGNVITLPDELQPPLPKQRFALQFRICGYIGCPSDKLVSTVQPTPPPSLEQTYLPPPQPPVILQGNKNCFCLDVFVIGHFKRETILGKESLLGKVDSIDIVDIKPDALEDNINCYLKTTVNVILREKLAIPIEKFFLSFSLLGLASVTLSPTANPPIPYNPAIEEDQLKVFMTMKVVGP